jgi:hypothetical protein
MSVSIYLDIIGGSSNFHTIILKKSFEDKTYIMALGHAGGRVYEEFFGQFLTNEKFEDIGKVSNSIGSYQWENSVKLSFDETNKKTSLINEILEDLNEVDQNLRDLMFIKLEEFILYGDEAEKIKSDFPVLKENVICNLTSEIDGVFMDKEWDEDYMYISQESFWPLSLRFSD